MERLFIMDMKNYDKSLPRYRRPSVRGIIIRDGKVAMVYSRKYSYYKFPGGGIESGEDHITALVREVREETGLTQENYYYLCEVTGTAFAQKLDDYELDEGFTLRYVTPQEVIETNRCTDHGNYDTALIEREARVLEHLIEKELI